MKDSSTPENGERMTNSTAKFVATKSSAKYTG